MQRKWAVLLVLVPLTAASGGRAADRLLHEDFDDRVLDPGFVVYGSNWEELSPPQYTLDETGRGGAGYCFGSGTVSEAYLCWMNDVPNPWPSDELYVSFWMRYPTFESTDSMENFKVFYPHWNGARSYVHYSMASTDSIYYSARGNEVMLTTGNWLSCPGQADGAWHHYEFYVQFSTGTSRFWYDGELKVDDAYGEGVWIPNTVYYVSAPSIDAEEPGVFSRQVDDWEAWDGMPDEPPPPDVEELPPEPADPEPDAAEADETEARADEASEPAADASFDAADPAPDPDQDADEVDGGGAGGCGCSLVVGHGATGGA
jgi:hypothetical protein